MEASLSIRDIDRLRQVEEDLKIKVRELERQVEKKQGEREDLEQERRRWRLRGPGL